jgi:hypothetical protein
MASMGLIATFAVGMIAPMAQASDQSNKNNWRNIAIGAGAATLYGLSQHNNTVSILGALGTAYSLKKYEDARHKQSVDNSYRSYYHRTYRHWHSGYYTRDGRGVRHWHSGYWTY